MRNIIRGALIPISGFKIIVSSTKLMAIALVPFAIASVIFIFGIAQVAPLLDGWVSLALSYFTADPENILYNFFYYPLMAIFWVVFLITLTLGVYLIASILASPFNGLLAELVLMRTKKIPEEALTFLPLLINSLRMLKISLLRSIALLLIGGVLFLTSFIPGLNLVTAFIAFILIAFDAADYSFESARLSLAARFSRLRGESSLFIGMGLVIGLFAIIPGLLLFMMPLMVAGYAAESRAFNKG
jgi:CysZ protein